jgi:hypothetical protein
MALRWLGLLGVLLVPVPAAHGLVGLPKGRYSVKIVVVTEAGKILTTTRRYRTCAPRRRG